MSIIVFILLGVAVYAFTREFFNSTGVDIAIDLSLGVTGAVTAGVLFGHIGTTDVAGLTIGGIAGATVPLAAYHAVFGEPRHRRG
jgi:uncharacterized membrane protein YeaQ/YmgE (transglycosylase-associated protein family)